MSELFDGCSVMMQIRIPGVNLTAGLDCMGQQDVATLRSHGPCSSTMRTPISKIAMAKSHYMWRRNMGRLMSLDCCLKMVSM